MSYSRTNYGPGDIAALQSGIGLTMGPTIGSNDPGVPMSGMGTTPTTYFGSGDMAVLNSANLTQLGITLTPCERYRCPGGTYPSDAQVGGCSIASCLPSRYQGFSFCCPRRPEQPASITPTPQPETSITPAPPPPPSIVYSTPQVQQTAPQGHGPLFWVGLGAVGIGLFLVLRGGKK